MRKLFVVRHADAGPRGAHDEPDDQRALSKRGRRQAEGLLQHLAEAGIVRLLASPSLRCRQTLAPLGTRLSVEVEADDRLAEGRGAAGALAVADEAGGSVAAICSHGDVIPDLLDALVARGCHLEDELRWQKASTWVLTGNEGQWLKGRYLPPPS